MISISRSWTRELRAIFRRLSPSRAHSNLTVQLTVEANTLIARCVTADGAVECRQSSPQDNAQVMVPLEALADCEGKDSTPVTIQALGDKSVELRWTHNGVPQVRGYEQSDFQAKFPEPPAEWTTNSSDLLDALDEAVNTTAESGTRYALDHIQFKGSTGEIIASDSKQLLIHGGFEFPWKDSPLVSRLGAGAGRGLGRMTSVDIGRTEGWIWFRTGGRLLALRVDAHARYPDVTQIIPTAKSDTRLVLDPTDADMLATVLPDLPGVEDPSSPVTVDLNGHVSIRAKTDGQAQPTELVLQRSRVVGDPMRFAMDRNHLSRAHRLGFDTVRIVSPSRPLVCRDGRRSFVMMPLYEQNVIPASDDVLRVNVSDERPVLRPKTVRASAPVEPAPARVPLKPRLAGVAKSAPPSSTAGPIEEAMAIQTDLRRVLGRLRGLSALIRRQRQQHRLLKTTMASLRQLQQTGT